MFLPNIYYQYEFRELNTSSNLVYASPDAFVVLILNTTPKSRNFDTSSDTLEKRMPVVCSTPAQAEYVLIMSILPSMLLSSVDSLTVPDRSECHRLAIGCSGRVPVQLKEMLNHPHASIGCRRQAKIQTYFSIFFRNSNFIYHNWIKH